MSGTDPGYSSTLNFVYICPYKHDDSSCRQGENNRMALIKRPFFWVVMLLVLALAGMALYVYIVGTRTLLAHAEDFSFRRLDVA